MIRFKFLTGDVNFADYGGKWISCRKFNNGEFDYWLVIELINWADAVGEREAPAKYNVSLSVVSPDQAGEENIQAAMKSCGITDEMLKAAEENGWKDECLVEALHGYGVHAQIWNENGDNLRKLMREAHHQAYVNGIFFGFQMDRPVNAIGATGWDAVRGDITRPLREAAGS